MYFFRVHITFLSIQMLRKIIIKMSQDDEKRDVLRII